MTWINIIKCEISRRIFLKCVFVRNHVVYNLNNVAIKTYAHHPNSSESAGKPSFLSFMFSDPLNYPRRTSILQLYRLRVYNGKAQTRNVITGLMMGGKCAFK